MARVSKYVERTPDGKYIGYIYKRILVKECEEKGKVYIGATSDLKGRNTNWGKKANRNYGGEKITTARMKYNNLGTYWKTEIVEKVIADTEEELSKKLDEREQYWIDKHDSIANGFNEFPVRKGRIFSDTHKANISMNHRHYQTEETKKKLSEAQKGRTVSPEVRLKISNSLKGIPMSDERRKAMSESRKGKEPKAASAGLKAYLEKYGHGPTKGIKQTPQARANMKAAQQKRGTDTIAIAPNGNETLYNTMKDAAHETGHNVGSVASCIKTNGITRKGYRFRKA